MIRYRTKQIADASLQRPVGFLEDVLSRGKITGEWIEFDDETYRELVAKYRGDTGGCQGCGQ